MTTTTILDTQAQVLALAVLNPDAVLVCTRYATSLDLNGTTYVALSSGGAS